jgi:multicomponent Na+:H+ antiporter subunit E
MYILWIIFSGMFDPMLLWLGAISCLIVAALSHTLIFPYPRWSYIRYFVGFLAYLPWLMWKVFQANIHLLRLIFHPRMMDLIDPQIVSFQTELREDLSITAMANSITLTPGTITVSADHRGNFKVHAIDRLTAEELPGAMGQKVKRVFEE